MWVEIEEIYFNPIIKICIVIELTINSYILYFNKEFIYFKNKFLHFTISNEIEFTEKSLS